MNRFYRFNVVLILQLLVLPAFSGGVSIFDGLGFGFDRNVDLHKHGADAYAHKTPGGAGKGGGGDLNAFGRTGEDGDMPSEDGGGSSDGSGGGSGGSGGGGHDKGEGEEAAEGGDVEETLRAQVEQLRTMIAATLLQLCASDLPEQRQGTLRSFLRFIDAGLTRGYGLYEGGSISQADMSLIILFVGCMLGRDLSMVSDGVFEVIVGFDISEDKILTYMVGIKRDMLARNAITEAAILGFVRDAVEEIMRVAEA